MILRCKALEICAEGCITSGVSADKEATLAQMFGSFLPNDGGALANQLVRLSSLLSDDAPDTVGAAQRAVHSLVASLKASAAHGPAEADAANPVEGWISRVGALDKDIAHQHNLVAKLVDIASKGAVTRCAWRGDEGRCVPASYCHVCRRRTPITNPSYARPRVRAAQHSMLFFHAWGVLGAAAAWHALADTLAVWACLQPLVEDVVGRRGHTTCHCWHTMLRAPCRSTQPRPTHTPTIHPGGPSAVPAGRRRTRRASS